MKKTTIKKNILFITIITLIIIIFSEICMRIFIFSLSGKKEIFFYGNQKVFLEIIDLSEFNFFVETINKNNHSLSSIKNINKSRKRLKTNGTIDFINGTKSFLSNSLFNHNPKVGDMILFPNNLMHTAYPFKREGERRSFSFNIDIDKKTFDIFNG